MTRPPAARTPADPEAPSTARPPAGTASARARLVAFERAALLRLHTGRRRGLVLALAAITWSGATIGWGVLVIALGVTGVLVEGTRAAMAELLAAGAASGVTAVLANGLKLLVRRPRPWLTLPELQPLAAPRERWSFPSSHAATSAAFAAALLVVGHPLAAVVAAWSLVVAFSRVYLSLHYPSDVLAGAVLGVGIGVPFGWLAWTPLTRRVVDWLTWLAG